MLCLTHSPTLSHGHKIFPLGKVKKGTGALMLHLDAVKAWSVLEEATYYIYYDKDKQRDFENCLIQYSHSQKPYTFFKWRSIRVMRFTHHKQAAVLISHLNRITTACLCVTDEFHSPCIYNFCFFFNRGWPPDICTIERTRFQSCLCSTLDLFIKLYFLSYQWSESASHFHWAPKTASLYAVRALQGTSKLWHCTRGIRV